MTTILICIPCLLTGGTEIQTLSLVRALVSNEYSVVTVCYYEHTDVMVQQYREAGSMVELLAEDGMRKHGREEWQHLYKGLKKCINKHHPLVAHVQYMAPGALPCIILKWLRVRHIIATAHTDARIYRNLLLLHLLQRYVLDVFTCITLRAEVEFFSHSNLYSETMELPQHAHTTIYNALPDHVKLTTIERNLSDFPVVGVVSRLEFIKGMDLVIPAFALLREKMPQVRLLVVGEGSLSKSMYKQAQKQGVLNAVEWAGNQPTEKLTAYYDSIDLLWMPSRSEGFGLVALEAMARACPVITSDVGGLPELVQKGVCGTLIPVGDIKALAELSHQILSSPKRWRQMSQAVRTRAEAFSMERFTRVINNLYRKMLRCSF